MRRNVLVAFALLVAVASLSYADSSADAVMKRSFGLPKAKSMQATVYMLLVEANGSQSLRVLSMHTREGSEGSDSYIEFLSPPDVKGTKFLSLAGGAGGDVQRLWLPELRRVRRIAGAGKGDKFIGSDLSYYDMSDHHFEESRYLMKGEGSVDVVVNAERRKTPCWVIESTPVDSAVPYARTTLWVGKEDSYVYRSTMWNARGEELKTIYILEVQRRQGIIIPLRTGVVTADGHKTLLQMNDVLLDRPVDPSLFTVANLER